MLPRATSSFPPPALLEQDARPAKLADMVQFGIANLLAPHRVKNMAQTAAAIISVANQPSTFSPVEITNCPIISERTAINIITTMIGTEMTPLMTALQYKALILS